VSGQLSAACYDIQCEAAWAPEPVWIWWEEKDPCPFQNSLTSYEVDELIFPQKFMEHFYQVQIIIFPYAV
jgi:hypothetical protein